MGIEAEGFNVEKTSFQVFMQDLEGKLALITGAGGVTPVDAEGAPYSFGLEEVRRPMLVLGLPGIGKTCGIRGIIEKLNATLPDEKKLGFKKTLLGQTVVGSMEGIPVVNPTTGKVVRVQIPDLPDPERDGEYGVYFLDEITTADEAQVQPALGLTDDSRNIGEYQLPEHWVVVAAGNGDDCANFVELHDMTINRFNVYDIAYDYAHDWKPWALNNKIDEMVIAFLNFSPETCIRVESSDLDKAGKQFPSPRSWTRLSAELEMRKAMGREVTESELPSFCSRIIGSKAAHEFAAFCAFKSKVNYRADAICNGTEKDPENMQEEVFHIILEQTMKYLNANVKCSSEMDASDTDIKYVGEAIKWFTKFEHFDTEKTINAIVEITRLGRDGLFGKIAISNTNYLSRYPEYDTFLDKHFDAIAEILNDYAA